MPIRTILSAALLCGVFAGALAQAQPWPHKPLRLVIPFPGAGGAADVTGRLAGQKIAEALGQPVVIENRPGGGGNIGIETVAKAAPDGYTLLVTAPSLTISPSLYKKLGFDPLRDFAPISLLAEIPNVITIRQSLPVATLREFIDYGRANPGKLNFGTSGLGTATHLATVLFLSQAGIKGVNVVYKGSSQALVAMIGNEVDLVVIGPPAALPHIQAGRVKALAVMRDTRLPTLPQVPTTKEAGVPNTEVTTWYGLLAPVGTPRPIVQRLNEIWTRAAATPEIRDRMHSTGADVVSNTPEQFAAMIRAEVPRWRKVITDANIQIE
jgi:tripartite-type tricarboxylate transporter receptor subunit TctC